MSIDRTYGVAEGNGIKAPCRVATTGNITLGGLQSIDSVTTVAGDRVLVKNQTDTVTNGIYTASSGNWLRTADFDGAYDIVNGSLILVVEGTANQNQLFMVTSANPIVVGTSAITFALNTSIGTAGDISTALSASPVFPVDNINTAGLDLLQLTGGTPAITSDYAYNRIVVANDATNASAVNFVTSALSVELDTGGSNINNEKTAIRAVTAVTVAGADFNQDIQAVVGQVSASQNLGGTNTAGGEKGSLYAINPSAVAHGAATNLGVVSGGEIDAWILSPATAAFRWGWSMVSGGDTRGAVSDAAIHFSSITSTAWKHILSITSLNGSPAIAAGGTIIGSDGSAMSAAAFADLDTIDFSSFIMNFKFFQVGPNGQLVSTTNATSPRDIQTGATYTISNIDSSVVLNHAGTVTLSLPSAVTYPGRWLYLKTVTANTVVSASSDVVPQIGGAAGTAILAATAGKWAALQSTGGAWEIMMSN